MSKLWLYKSGSTEAKFCSVFTSKNTGSSYLSEWEHTDGYTGKNKKRGFLVPITVHCLVYVLLSAKGERKYGFHGFWKLLNTPVEEKQIFSREASWHKPFLFQCFKRKQ